MKICMIGAGYVGLVSAACFSEFGWSVTCVENDPTKLKLLNDGGVPIYEPGLDDLLARNASAGRISFTGELAGPVRDADLIFLMIDARAGLTPMDEHFADWVRHRDKPVVLIANKCESTAGDAGIYDSYRLGLGDPIAISAEHGDGIADLFNVVQSHAEMLQDDEDDDATAEGVPLQLAIIGRPNTGKSTLVNRLIGEDRLLTGPEAGITRDSITVDWEYRGKPLRLVDTAGMRRRSRVDDKLEKLSVADTQRSIRFANVAVLMLDATVMLEKQDLTIARQVIDEGRALIIAANKWDSVNKRDEALRSLRDRLQTSMPQVRGIPVVTISALNGQNLDELMNAVFSIYEVWNRRVSTSRLNSWLELMIEAHPPPLTGLGRRLRLRYMTQVKSRPPTFAVFGSRTEELPEAYRRYLVNGLRTDFDLDGVPIRMQLRSGKNPYAPKKK